MRSKSFKWFALLIGLGAAVVVLSNLELPQRCIPLSGTGPISVELSHIARGEAKLFCYRGDSGDKIRFILARSNDGAVHSVFDACRQCYSYRKGYRLTRNGALICRLCGNRYSIDHMMAGKASCVPVALPYRQVGSVAHISSTDIHAGRVLF
jgi:uncharacterized membrane protein